MENDVQARSGDRVSALRDLVEIRKPAAEASAALAQFGWDSDVELVILTASDVVRVLDRYLSREMSADEVEIWAEALDGRDDVAFQHGYEELLRRAIFELSTPEIHEPITPEMATRLRARLKVQSRS